MRRQFPLVSSDEPVPAGSRRAKCGAGCGACVTARRPGAGCLAAGAGTGLPTPCPAQAACHALGCEHATHTSAHTPRHAAPYAVRTACRTGLRTPACRREPCHTRCAVPNLPPAPSGPSLAPPTAAPALGNPPGDKVPSPRPEGPQNTPQGPQNTQRHRATAGSAHPILYQTSGTSDTPQGQLGTPPQGARRGRAGFFIHFSAYFLFVTNIQFFKYRLVKLHLQKSATVRSAR